MTVSEVFAKQLMQISGVSPDKAVAILEKYPTPKRYIHSTLFLIAKYNLDFWLEKFWY